MIRTRAFIFARGGSKGIKRKNLVPFNGIPLIAHSILLAQKLSCIEKIYVSTDSEEIADVSRMYGASIIKRPIELASDSSPEWLSWQHAIKYSVELNGNFDKFISLPTTSPLRIKSDAGGLQFTTNSGTAGSSGATVTYQPGYPTAPNDLRYYCTVHGNAMGNTITMNNPNTTTETIVTSTTTQTNPLGTPDPTAEYPREIFQIDRKATENREVVSFELAAPSDMAGVRAPKRQCTRAEFPSIGLVTG